MPRTALLLEYKMDTKDPFAYPFFTYAWVIGLSAIASVVRYLNNMSQFSLGRLCIDAFSGGFTGLLTFWLCEWSGIHGPLSAFLIGVSGLMGSRAWQEFSNILRIKFGLPMQDQNGNYVGGTGGLPPPSGGTAGTRPSYPKEPTPK